MRQHWLTYSAACSQARAIDWLLTSGHVDPDDGAREAAAREATADEVRATISNDFGLKINESELLDRWDEVCREIESGQTVTVLRDAQPLAIVTPP